MPWLFIALGFAAGAAFMNLWRAPVPPIIIGALIGFVGAVVAEPVRRSLFSARLRLDFGKDGAYQTTTLEGPNGGPPYTKCRYIRIKVMNTKRNTVAKACRPYLIKVQKADGTGTPQETIYCDSLRLKWSAMPETDKGSPLDLAHGVNQFIDLLSMREGNPNFRMEFAHRMLNRYKKLFEESGTFFFTVLVVSDNAPPQRTRVRFEWTGEWDQYDADVAES